MKSKVFSKPAKDIKKALYQSRAFNFKKLLSSVVIGGVVAVVAYTGYHIYTNSAVSEAHLVLTYPEIAQSHYPDGSRFTYYDFISDDRIQDALNIMQRNGKYTNFTVDDLRDHFYVYGYLESSASSNVSSERSEGNDFSYVANEYGITFVQPHDYKNANIFKKFFGGDDSDEFLKALIEANKNYISKTRGGIDGFNTITELDNTDNYDYEEKIEIYRVKKNTIASFLRNLNREASSFRSNGDNMSIKDIQGNYELLISNKIDAIANYVDSTGISKNAEITANKVRVNIENNRLEYNKVFDEAGITQYAMTNYDHTFTENLINVVRDDNQGLYQARPKTAFDEVVVKMNHAKQEVIDYNEELYELDNDLNRYLNTEQTEETQRIAQKCDQLFEELDKEYNEFTKQARAIVDECLNQINKDFLTATVKKSSLFNTSLVIKEGIIFLIGALIAFILSLYLLIFTDHNLLKKKQKKLNEIRREKIEDERE